MSLRSLVYVRPCVADVRNVVCTLDDEDDVLTSLPDDVIVVDNQPVTASPIRRVFDSSRLGMSLSLSVCACVCVCVCVTGR